MTPAVDAIFGGVIVGAALIGFYVMAEIALLALGRRRSLAQIISHAWHARPRCAPRERRTRPQGPGN